MGGTGLTLDRLRLVCADHHCVGAGPGAPAPRSVPGPPLDVRKPGIISDDLEIVVASLSERIIEHAATLSEAAPICAAGLLHLGNRASVGQALSRLARARRLFRICRGVYMRTFQTRFGRRGPEIEKAIPALSALWGETIVPAGGSAANVLGLSTQIPIRSVYLTSGPDRRLNFGAVEVVRRHAPRWQLVAPYRSAGNLVRALTFLHRYETEEAIARVVPRLSDEDRAELVAALPILPSWLARPLGAFLAAT